MPLGNLPVNPDQKDLATITKAKPKKLVWVLGIGLCLVILVALGFATYRYFQKHPNKPQLQSQSSSAPDLAASIIKSGKIEDCIQLNDQVANGVDYQTVCQNNIAENQAQTNLDIKACDQLDNKLMAISDCQQMVIAGLVNKEGNLSVCNQFSGDLKTSCTNTYWSITAVKQKNPQFCTNLIPSSEQAIANCQSFVLTSLLQPMSKASSSSVTAQTCALFSGSAKTDCNNYLKGDCQALSFQPLQQACQRRGR